MQTATHISDELFMIEKCTRMLECTLYYTLVEETQFDERYGKLQPYRTSEAYKEQLGKLAERYTELSVKDGWKSYRRMLNKCVTIGIEFFSMVYVKGISIFKQQFWPLYETSICKSIHVTLWVLSTQGHLIDAIISEEQKKAICKLHRNFMEIERKKIMSKKADDTLFDNYVMNAVRYTEKK
jgi:hypothetical protein